MNELVLFDKMSLLIKAKVILCFGTDKVNSRFNITGGTLESVFWHAIIASSMPNTYSDSYDEIWHHRCVWKSSSVYLK